jgi:hypothetical protein
LESQVLVVWQDEESEARKYLLSIRKQAFPAADLLKTFEQQTRELERNVHSCSLQKDAKDYLPFLTHYLMLGRPEVRMFLIVFVALSSYSHLGTKQLGNELPIDVKSKLDDYGVNLDDKILLFLRTGN